jgi:multidrug efflux pump subunit AcrA (membrane-fusion protein)
MMRPPEAARRPVRAWAAGLAVSAAVFASGCGGPAQPDVATGRITRGDYTDVVEIRGDVKPVRTTVVKAPRNAGELLILKIARNGAAVKAGDVVAEFDAVNMRRTIQQKQSDLRSALAQQQQSEAQAVITLEEKAAAVRRAAFEVERATLAMGDVGLVSQIEAERGRLDLADAQQRLREAEAAAAATKAGLDSDAIARARAIDKTRADLERAQSAVSALAATAPIDGIVNVLPNYQSSTPMGVPQEFRAGDRTYSGATVLELPDLSSVYLVARIDEADRGPIRSGQRVAVRAEAVPNHEYQGTVTDISLLARTDFMGGWPPAKLFDLVVTIDDSDGRLRPGMTVTGRIDVGRLPDVLLAPAEAVFTVDGQTRVYRRARRGFDAVPVTVIRRGRDQAAVTGDVTEGDEIALVRPDLAAADTGAGGGSQ